MSRRGHAVLGAALSLGSRRVARHLLARDPRWLRRNYRGREVSLAAGPVLALAVSAASTAPLPAAVLAGLGAGAVGRVDDVLGERAEQRSAKGLRGHAAALRQGQLTSGAIKVAGLTLVGLLSSIASGQRALPRVLLDGAVVAGTANLVNLLDLRPGRALKAGLLTALVLDEPGVAAACAVLLPDDVRERTMIGDAGANALGAVLGRTLTSRVGPRALPGVVILTVASELVSFTRVIERVPPLRVLDELGRA